jgi:hypothetical protein
MPKRSSRVVGCEFGNGLGQAGEPRFVLHPGDGLGFRCFLGEAEALWAGAKPHTLD